MDEQYGQLIEPQQVPFAFGAPGWYVLTVLILLALGTIAWLITWYIKKNRYRKKALAAIATAEINIATSTPQALVYETNMLMKRIAMSRYQRNETAGLRGNEWISFLNKTMKTSLFDEADNRLLESGIYSNEKNEAASFINKAKSWIKKHR